jgi:hypothetical protein
MYTEHKDGRKISITTDTIIIKQVYSVPMSVRKVEKLCEEVKLSI